MAQLVARLVRNEKVGGSNPPSSTRGRHPIRMSVFCMPGCVVAVLVAVLLWRRWCSGLSGVLLCGAWPLCVPVGSGLPALCCLWPHGCFGAPSGPAAREIATPELKGSEWSISKPARTLRTLRRPPHQWCLWCCVRWHVVSRPALALSPPTGTVARRHRRPPVRSGTLVKPSSPLLARAPSLVKPTAPLRARYNCLRRYFGAQRRRGFHGGVLRSLHWC